MTMPFSYTAANSEGKKLTGIINAASPEDAKEQLNLLGLSILEIKPIEQTPGATATSSTANPDLQKLQFEATDKNGKQIKGTIPAKTPLFAYKRLVEEYHFTVQALGPLPEGSSLEEIKNQYDVERHEKKTEKIGIGKPLSEDPAFLMEKELLLKQIEEILQKVRTMLAQYETKISPEKRADIEGTIDKLLRIKSSNNLDYIRHTCTELLKKVQEDEVFLTGVEHDQERSSVVMESQRMMLELQKAAAAKADIGAQIRRALERAEEKLRHSKWKFLLHPLEEMKQSFQDPPEVERLKTQKKVLSSGWWDAIKIALKTPKDPKEFRKAAWQNVKTLGSERREVVEKLKSLRRLQAQKGLLIREERKLHHLEELTTFTGWLLFFYLLYYYLGYYVITEGLPLKPFLGIPFDLHDSALFKYLLALIFLVHAAATLKLNFFLRNKTATLVLVPVTVFTALLVVFNM